MRQPNQNDINRSPYLIGTGFSLSDPDVNYDATKPLRACLLCGTIYQNDSYLKRQRWADAHAKTHTEREHMLLKLSGLSMTPEAAFKLAAYGIIALSDMVLSEEAASALMESHPAPTSEVEV